MVGSLALILDRGLDPNHLAGLVPAQVASDVDLMVGLGVAALSLFGLYQRRAVEVSHGVNAANERLPHLCRALFLLVLGGAALNSLLNFDLLPVVGRYGGS